jgi:hypothetical protein
VAPKNSPASWASIFFEDPQPMVAIVVVVVVRGDVDY